MGNTLKSIQMVKATAHKGRFSQDRIACQKQKREKFRPGEIYSYGLLVSVIWAKKMISYINPLTKFNCEKYEHYSKISYASPFRTQSQLQCQIPYPFPNQDCFQPEFCLPNTFKLFKIKYSQILFTPSLLLRFFCVPLKT